MRTVLQRFLSFNAENVASEIYLALGLVYLILLAVSVSSLVKSPVRGKWLWFSILLFLPIMGMYFYVIASILRADFTFLSRFGLLGSKLAAPSRSHT